MPDNRPLGELKLNEIVNNTKLCKDVIVILIDAIAQECYTSGLQMGFERGKAYGQAHTETDMKIVVEEGIEE